MKIASFSLGEVLQTSGDTEVGDGFQRGVQEKAEWSLVATVNDYGSQNIMWSDNVEQDVPLCNRFLVDSPARTRVAAAEPPLIRALDSEIPGFLFSQG